MTPIRSLLSHGSCLAQGQAVPAHPKPPQQAPQRQSCRPVLDPQPSEASPKCVTVEDKAAQGSEADISSPGPGLGKSWASGVSHSNLLSHPGTGSHTNKGPGRSLVSTGYAKGPGSHHTVRMGVGGLHICPNTSRSQSPKDTILQKGNRHPGRRVASRPHAGKLQQGHLPTLRQRGPV